MSSSPPHLWDPNRTPPSPVIVLGMHNSGTTLLARILHNRGLFLGCNAGMHESFFFSHFIANRVVMGGEEAAWSKLPIMSVDDVLSKHDVAKGLIEHYWRMDYVQWGYDGEGPWGFKDPRSCVLLPLYLRIFPDAKLLTIRRNVDDIAASLAHRFKPGVGILNDVPHWRELAVSYLARVDEFGKPHKHYFEIDYEELCRSPEPTLKSIYEYLELPLPAEAVNFATAVVKRSSIGTSDWSERRWRWESRKRRWKSALAPLYDLLRGR